MILWVKRLRIWQHLRRLKYGSDNDMESDPVFGNENRKHAFFLVLSHVLKSPARTLLNFSHCSYQIRFLINLTVYTSVNNILDPILILPERQLILSLPPVRFPQKELANNMTSA